MLVFWLLVPVHAVMIGCIGLGVIASKSLAAILSEFLIVGGFEGLFLSFLFWLITCVGSLARLLPTRVMYIPWVVWRLPRRDHD
jgi:hypothetical protein